jgi:hypothetical protein
LIIEPDARGDLAMMLYTSSSSSSLCSALGLLAYYDNEWLHIINPAMAFPSARQSIRLAEAPTRPHWISWDSTGRRIAVLLADGILHVLAMTWALNDLRVVYRGKLGPFEGGAEPTGIWLHPKTAPWRVDGTGKPVKSQPQQQQPTSSLPSHLHGLVILAPKAGFPCLITLVGGNDPSSNPPYTVLLLDGMPSIEHGPFLGLLLSNEDPEELFILAAKASDPTVSSLTPVRLMYSPEHKGLVMHKIGFSTNLPFPILAASLVHIDQRTGTIWCVNVGLHSVEVHWFHKASKSGGVAKVELDEPIESVVYLGASDCLHLLTRKPNVYALPLHTISSSSSIGKEDLTPIQSPSAGNLVFCSAVPSSPLLFCPSTNQIGSHLLVKFACFPEPTAMLFCPANTTGLATQAMLARLNGWATTDIAALLASATSSQHKVFEQELYGLMAANQLEAEYGVDWTLRVKTGCPRTRQLGSRLKQISRALRYSISVDKPDTFQQESLLSLVGLSSSLLYDLDHLVRCIQLSGSLSETCGILLTRGQPEAILQVVRHIDRLRDLLSSLFSTARIKIIADFWGGQWELLDRAWEHVNGPSMIQFLEGLAKNNLAGDTKAILLQLSLLFPDTKLPSKPKTTVEDVVTGLELSAETPLRRCTGCGSLSCVPDKFPFGTAAWMSAWNLVCPCGNPWVLLHESQPVT